MDRAHVDSRAIACRVAIRPCCPNVPVNKRRQVLSRLVPVPGALVPGTFFSPATRPGCCKTFPGINSPGVQGGSPLCPLQGGGLTLWLGMTFNDVLSRASWDEVRCLQDPAQKPLLTCPLLKHPKSQ